MVGTINIKSNQPEHAADLRRKAEATVAEEAFESPDEMRRILHELHVHQIELEMQNEELHRALDELAISRTHYCDLYDLAPVGYCTLSEQGLILQTNLTAASLLGVVRSEMLKKPITQFIAKEDQDIYYLHRQSLIKPGDPQACELRVMKSDGTECWMHLTSTVREDVDGMRVLSVVLTCICKRKHAEEALLKSELLFRALMHNTSDAILLVDMNGNFEQINHAGEVLLGFSQSEICQMNLTHIHPAAELADVRRHFEDIATKGLTPPHETKITRKDGQVLDIEIRPSLIEIDERKLVQGIYIDLTERKRHENARLAHEMKLRSVLVREVHHRIKNNLQGITGMLRQFTQQHPETAVPINQAISQVHSISVIHGLQGLAITSSIRACELTVAIAAGVESLWQKPITVEIPNGWIPCTIIEEEAVPLALVLNELISNAVKHSGADGQIRIIFSHEPRYDAIRLTINNSGQIPPCFGLEPTTDFGTGLQLVASLLPRAGASLTWSQQGDIVVTTLGLDKPLIQLESAI